MFDVETSPFVLLTLLACRLKVWFSSYGLSCRHWGRKVKCDVLNPKQMGYAVYNKLLILFKTKNNVLVG